MLPCVMSHHLQIKHFILCQKEGVEELILFPMYPQYSTTTTLSSVEDIEQRCEEMDYHPKITVIDPYYDDYDYIEAML